MKFKDLAEIQWGFVKFPSCARFSQVARIRDLILTSGISLDGIFREVLHIISHQFYTIQPLYLPKQPITRQAIILRRRRILRENYRPRLQTRQIQRAENSLFRSIQSV